MKRYELTEEQFEELMRLCRRYRTEADRCVDAKSYLAACVMIGAALEAVLTAMCHCYRDDIPEALIPKEKSGKAKHLLKWRFVDLIRVARQYGWLPVAPELDEERHHNRAHSGDYAVVLKEIRDLANACCYLRDFQKTRLTKRRMQMCFEILEVASDHLEAKLHAALKAEFEKE